MNWTTQLTDTEDTLFHAMVGRVNRGEECPSCHGGKARIVRTTALGIPLFECKTCGETWFDIVTRPTEQ